MSNWIESDDKKTCAYYKIIHRKLCLWGKQEFSRRKRYPKIEKPAWNIFHFIRSVNEMRKMQRTTGERYVPNSWQLNWHLRRVPEDLPRKATLPVADCIIALASCMRILSLIIFKKLPSIQFSCPSAGYCWALVCVGSPGQPRASPCEFYLAQ